MADRVYGRGATLTPMPRFAQTLSTWLDHVAPRRCALCGLMLAPGAFPGVCVGCLLDLPGARARRCPRCGLADAAQPACANCRRRPPAFDATLVAADYAAPLDRLVTAMKFGRRIGLARPLGELLAACWLGHGSPPLDIVVPVPLAPRRLAHRGFNQALEMGRAWRGALAQHHRRQVVLQPRALRRVRDTPAQAGLPLAERSRNLAGCFACTVSLRGLRVAVIDDVMTSGHTLAEAARTLKEAGAASVLNLVVARTA